jgi:hypothetical protein
MAQPKPGEATVSPLPGRPPANADEIAQAVAQAQATLATAAGSGGIERDPYRLALAGLSAAIGVLPKHARRVEDSLVGTVTELNRLAQALRHPLTPEERATFTADAVKAAHDGARTGARAAAASIAAQARATEWRSLLLFAGALAVAVAVMGTAMFYAGRESVRAETAATIAAQRAEIAMAEERLNVPPAQARVWLRWMQANLNPAAAERHAASVTIDDTGRRSAFVPLWLDPPSVPSGKKK